jgi:hypothetical protein
LDTIPYAGLSLLFAIIAMFGKTRIVGSSTFMETLLMACKSCVFYIQKFFVPLNLTTFYPYQKIITISSPDFYVPLIIVLVLIVLIAISFRRFPWISAGLLVFSAAPSSVLSFATYNYTSQNLVMPTASQQQQIWHRINTSLLGDTVQVGITLNDAQMRDPNFGSQFEEIELHSIVIDVQPSQVLA